MSATEAGLAAKIGAEKILSDAEIKIYSPADGGEGTCKTLTEGLGGKIKSVEVKNPLGEKIFAEFGEVPEKNLAIIEIASAAGLPLVPEKFRNPLNTTTYGVGEIILSAARDGMKNFLIGIGGSATNDCGLGMLTALGFKFLDADGKPCGIFGRDLKNVRAIKIDEIAPEISGCKFRIACDVKNPLTGKDGCSAIYAPQKGADEKIVRDMDGWIKNFSELGAEVLKPEKKSAPGDGAAGGLGYAFRIFLNGELVPGIELVADVLNIREDLKNADIVITGEGAIDEQTLRGKTPAGIAKLTKNLNPSAKVVAIGGAVNYFDDTSGIDAAFSILRRPTTLSDSMKKINATENISFTVEQIIRLLK